MNNEQSPKLNKDDKKLIKAIRRQSEHAELDPEFSAALKQQLKQQFNEKQAATVQPISKGVPLSLYALLASFVMAIPVLLAIIITLGSTGSVTQNITVTPAVDEKDEEVLTSDVKTLRAEFASLINAGDFETVKSYLADEVTVSVDGTDCCGTLLRVDAATELGFQLDGKGQFDFSETSEELQLIAAQNPDYQNYRFGITEAEFVLGYTLNDAFEVDMILFAQYSNLVSAGAEQRVSAVWDQINAADEQALRGSLAVEVEFVELETDCCGSLARGEAANRILSIAQSERPFTQHNGAEAEIASVLARYPELTAFILGISENGTVIGFQLNDEGAVDRFVVLQDKIVDPVASVCTEGSSVPGVTGAVVYEQPLNITGLSKVWESSFTTTGRDTAVNSRLFFSIVDNKLTATEISTGRIAWQLNGVQFANPKMTANEEVVLLQQEDALYVVDIDSRELLWGRSASLSGKFAAVRPLMVCDYVITARYNSDFDTDTLNAFAADGSGRVWSQQLQGIVRVQPVYSQDLGIVFITDHSGNLFAFNAANGDIVWRVRLDFVPTALTLAGGQLFVGETRQLSAYDAQSGRRMYTQQQSNTIREIGLTQDRVLLRIDSRGIFSMNAADGTDVREAKYIGVDGFISVGDQVIMISDEGRVLVTDGRSLTSTAEYDIHKGTVVRGGFIIDDLLVFTVNDTYYGLRLR